MIIDAKKALKIASTASPLHRRQVPEHIQDYFMKAIKFSAGCGKRQVRLPYLKEFDDYWFKIWSSEDQYKNDDYNFNSIQEWLKELGYKTDWLGCETTITSW